MMKTNTILLRAALTIALFMLAGAGVYLLTQKPNDNSIRVGYIPVTHCIPLYVAVHNNIFVNQGITVSLVPLSGGPKILQALASGDIDVGFSNVASILIARANGIPISPFTGGPVETPDHKDHAILVKPDSPIKTGADLKGKRIALNSRQNIDHLMIQAYLELHDLTEHDVTFLEVPFPRMNAALESNTVDAIASAEPFVTVGTSNNGFRVLDYNFVAVRERTFVSSYTVEDSHYRANQTTFDRFAAAIAVASDVANSDAQLSIRLLSEFTKIDSALAARVPLPRFAPRLDVENIRETAELLRKFHMLPANANFDILLDFQSGAK